MLNLNAALQLGITTDEQHKLIMEFEDLFKNSSCKEHPGMWSSVEIEMKFPVVYNIYSIILRNLRC